MFCIQCGQELASDSKFCIACGAEAKAGDSSQAKLQETDENMPDKNAVPALVQDSHVAEMPKAVNSATRLSQSHSREVEAEPEYTDTSTTGRRNIVLTMSVIVILGIVAAIALFILTGRGDEYMPNSHAANDAPVIDPAVQGEVSLYHIERVFYGSLADYPGAIVGLVFSQFFVNYVWTHFVSEGINYVSFFGEMPIDDASPISVQILFRFTPGDMEFNASSLFLDGIYQEPAVLYELLDSVLLN
ncbi:MAG: zinc ribbon domain-containing protein [Defluviitaleaceae bacterium]|nr:zinc ribbon domain-containing protein [Defluviitaleaceae bacterium]